MKVDNLDIQLIKELEKDGRENYVNLADKLGVAEGTIRYRLKHLLDNNVIKIATLPNLPRLGYSCTAIVGMQVKMTAVRSIANKLAQKPNVCYLTSVAGRYDLIAIVFTKTTQELSDFIELEVATIPGVMRTETYVNMNTIKGKWGMLDTSELI